MPYDVYLVSLQTIADSQVKVIWIIFESLFVIMESVSYAISVLSYLGKVCIAGKTMTT